MENASQAANQLDAAEAERRAKLEQTFIRNASIVGALAGLGVPVDPAAVMGAKVPDLDAPASRVLSPADVARIEAAEAKRARRAAKRTSA